MQMSDYQPQNRLYHYTTTKSYCKYSLLYEAVMGRTKDLNEVTKSLKSLILSLHAAGKQLKDIDIAGNRKRPPHKTTDSFTGLIRPTGSCEPPNSPNSPKSGVVVWAEKSLLQYLSLSRDMGFRCRKPATEPLLNRIPPHH